MDVTSRAHPVVKQCRRLLRDGKERESSRLFVTEGVRLCADALASGVGIACVLYTPQAQSRYPEVDALRAAAAQQICLTPELAAYIGDTVSPQGVFCLCKMLDKKTTFDTIRYKGKYIALERIQDPGNLGGIFRTAEALGADGAILIGEYCDRYNPKVLRSSMGGVFRLPVFETDDPAQTMALLRPHGMRFYACVADDGATAVQTVRFGPGSVCLIGNEGNGLRAETVQACDASVTIPMNGRAESLNAGTAAAIILWEMFR